MLACPGSPGPELGLDVRWHGERHRVHVAQELGEVRERVDAELLAERRRLVGVASPDSCKVNPGLTRQHCSVRDPSPIPRTYEPELQSPSQSAPEQFRSEEHTSELQSLRHL